VPEKKTLPFAELKIAGADGEAGSFEGYASVFGTVDSYADTIDPGAYTETIPQFLTRGFIGWGHNWNEPIGIVTSAREDARGLMIAGQFHSDPEAQKVRTRASERMAAGKFMGLSIGYEPLTWEMRQVDTPVRGPFGEFTDKVRALTKIKLFEVSLVTVPAEENSGVTSIKSDGFGMSFDDHSERVRVAAREWLERVRSGWDLRTKEGRAISSARRVRIEAVRDALRSHADEIETLLQETAPPEKAAEGVALFLEFQQTMARLNGVPVRS
jgi:HK97 family phage prohead protease